MARRKALKWHKWETKCADAAALVAPRPMLRFHFRDGSLLQRPASANGHKEQDTPPAAFLCITYILSDKTEKVTILSPTLQGSFLASPFVKAFMSARMSPWSNLVLAFLTTAPLKKPTKQKGKHKGWPVALFQVVRFQGGSKPEQSSECAVLIALQSVAGNSHFHMRQ